MASDGRNDLRSYLYLGLAGETGGAGWCIPAFFASPTAARVGAAAARLAREAGGARLGGAPAEAGDRLCRHAIRALSQRRPRRPLGEGRRCPTTACRSGRSCSTRTTPT